MANTRLRAGIVLFPLLLWACGGGGSATSTGSGAGGGGGGGGGTGGAGELPCDVAEVVAAKCGNCHAAQPIYGAPMPLVTAADFQAAGKSDPSKKVYELAGERIHDPVKPMPPPPTGPLDAASSDVLDAWIAAGAPAGEGGSCMGTGGSGAGGGSNLSCTPDVLLRPKTAWSMPKLTGDAYVCFGADAVVGDKRHITAIAPAVDNETIVHHILLYEVPVAVDGTPKACGAGASAGGRLVSVWAPGGQAIVMPPQAGLPIEGTGHYMIQMHYSNLMQLDGQTDRSGFDLCTTTELRPNDADILAFGTTKINIPAHDKLDLTCSLTVPAFFPKITTFGIMPHMHQLGTIISGDVLHAGGDSVALANRDPWSFDDQYWDTVETTIGPGDKVTTRCVWENPGNTNVTFGEDTSSEMCFVFAAYYPRVENANWNWGLPAYSSTCAAAP